MEIPLSSPDITSKEIVEIVKVLKTSYLSMGPKQAEFQQKFSAYIGTKYAQAVNSGTSALHLLMRAYGIGGGDEVITSPYSFIASSNCMLFTQAKPVFVDIDSKNWTMDVQQIEKKITRKTKAILAVHVFGMPADMVRIHQIAKKHKLIVIEDACEAIGAEINGQKVGTFSDAAVFGFYPNKQITTGEGGMLVTNDKKISEKCQSLKNQGRSIEDGKAAFVDLGYNYRLSDIQCALGLVQLSRIKEILQKRAQVAALYQKNLEGVDGLELLSNPEGYKRSWFVYVVKLSQEFSAQQRNQILKALSSKGIGCREYFPAIHLEPLYKKMFGYKRGDYPVTESVSDRTFALPFYNHLKEKEIATVCRELKRQIKIMA